MRAQIFTRNSFGWQYPFSLIIYLLINGLFLLKYASRMMEHGGLAVLIYALCIAGALVVFPRVPQRFNKAIFGVVSVLVLAGIVVLHQMIDPLTVDVDRWSAIDHFLQRLLQGEYPYLAQTHLGGYGSPFPFWNFFHLPFYALGDVGIGMIAVVTGLIFSIKRITGSYSGAAVFMLALAASPAFWYEVAVRSDLLYNFILCFLIGFWWLHSKITVRNSVWLTAIVSGFMLSTRLSVIIPFVMLLFPGFVAADWKIRIQFAAIAALCFILSFLPFIVWDFNQLVFFQYNPFVLQTRQGSVVEMFLLLGILLPLSLWWKGNPQRYATFTVITIVVFVGATFLHRMITDQFQSDLFSSRYDITYFNMSLPYVLLVLSGYGNSWLAESDKPANTPV